MKELFKDKRNIFNTVLFVVTLAILYLAVFQTELIESRILLEKVRPEYWRILGKVDFTYVDKKGDEEAYVIAEAKKDGFGNLNFSDLNLFLRAATSRFHEAKWITILFADGTGIEFENNNISSSFYGEVDERGQVYEGKSLDSSVSLIDQIEGTTAIIYKYDKKSNPIYEAHCDATGELVADESGIAVYYRRYDGNKHIIMERGLCPDKTPFINSVGYSEVEREYKDDDLIKESYFDGEGDPVERTDVLYATVRYEYNSEHRCTDEKYFDKEGKSVLSNAGYARVARIYDEIGELMSESFYGEDGKPILIPAGYASSKCSYDTERRLIRQDYYGIDGKPILLPAGYASYTRDYVGDDVETETYYDSEGKPVICAKGYAMVKKTYENEHVMLEEYYNEKKEPLERPGGYCAIKQEANDNTLSRIYLNRSLAPVLRDDGFSKVVWIIDEDGVTNAHIYDLYDREVALDGVNLLDYAYFGEDGWSSWMTPQKNVANSCLVIGIVNLGEKSEGDKYTCHVEIEFKDVESTEEAPFGFWAQGAQDGTWAAGNIWNSNLVSVTNTPSDGVYYYTNTIELSPDMAKISCFDIGFRCDYWRSGAFRVRNVKIEKGDKPSAWSPGL